MSLPGNALSVPARPGQLLAPDNLGRPLRTTDYELGGIALNDPSQGLQVRNWRLTLVGNEVRVAGDPYTTETVVFTETGITEVSMAFDANMQPAVAYLAFSIAKLRWYDATVPGYDTVILPSDARSLVLVMDDKRDSAAAYRDVLLFYIRTNRLCYRQQRERFFTERTLCWFEGNAVSISKAGMNDALRMQIELVGLKSRKLSRCYPATWVNPAYGVAASLARAMPAGLLAGDRLYAYMLHRSAATPPSGWVLVLTRACTNGTAQTLSVYEKSVVAPADSGVSQTFSQATSGVIGLGYFAVRSEAGAVTLAASASVAVDNTATNAVTPPASTAAMQAGELVMLVAMTINTNAALTMPTPPATSSLLSNESVSLTRLALAYEFIALATANSGSFTFDNGTPANNGLAAMTLRFSTA